MKLKLGTLEIKILKELSLKGPANISELAKALKKSVSRISKTATILESEGFIEKKKNHRIRTLSLTNNNYTQSLKVLFVEHPYIDYDAILSGSTLKILLPMTCNKNIKLNDIAILSNSSNINVTRILKKLKEKGILVMGNEYTYAISKFFPHLTEFIINFQHAINFVQASSFSSTSAVLWQRCDEFLIKTMEEKNKPGYFSTCYEKMSDFGISLVLTDSRYYYYSKTKKDLLMEDVVIHTLVLEQTPRNILYVLMLLAKNREKVDWKYLKLESDKYGLKNVVDELSGYLRTQGTNKPMYFPTWKEFKEKAEEYDICLQ